MATRSSIRARAGFLGLLVAALVLASCGSSGGEIPVGASPSPAPSLPSFDPFIGSVGFGRPVCSAEGSGSLNGPTYAGNRGTLSVTPEGCENDANYMRVWLEVDARGAEIDHYEWRIVGWRNAAPHGALAHHDGVIDIDLDAGIYHVRSWGNSVRYESATFATLQGLSRTFRQTIEVTAWARDGGSARATLNLDIEPAPDTAPKPVRVVRDGFEPELSPDGTRFVFTRMTDNTTTARSEIWLANVNGTGLTKLTSTTDSSDYCPQWVPGGTSVAFLRKTGAYVSSTYGELWEVHATTKATTQRTTYDYAASFCFYLWRGEPWVVLERDGDIHLSNGVWPDLNGWALRRLDGKDPQSPNDPSASVPDVAFFDATQLGAAGLVTLDPVNLDETELSNGGRFPWPCFAPRGSKIAAGADGGKSNGIWIMKADGTGLTLMTEVVSGEADHQPTWSKDILMYVHKPRGGSLRHGDIYRLDGVKE